MLALVEEDVSIFDPLIKKEIKEMKLLCKKKYMLKKRLYGADVAQ